MALCCPHILNRVIKSTMKKVNNSSSVDLLPRVLREVKSSTQHFRRKWKKRRERSARIKLFFKRVRLPLLTVGGKFLTAFIIIPLALGAYEAREWCARWKLMTASRVTGP